MTERRRGLELKQAIYQATIELLEEHGYLAVTFQNVAHRAHTSRGVLYRHWKDTRTLIYEAARETVAANPQFPGTLIDQNFNHHDLREDLLAMIAFLKFSTTLYPKNFFSFISFEESQGHHLMDNVTNNLIIMERILARAQERGEAATSIGQAAKLLPFDLLRYRLMVNGKWPDDAITTQIVDEILLPIYKMR